MTTPKELREKQAKLRAEARALHDAAKKAECELTAEECTRIDALLDSSDALDADIASAENAARRFDRLSAKPKAAVAATTVPATASVVVTGMEVDSSSTIVVGEPGMMDDPERGFANLGEFAVSVYNAGKPGAGFDGRLEMLAAASGMQQGVGAEGGFTVPPAFSTAIWDGLNTAANNLLAMTDNYTVEGESLTFLANAETSRATGSRYGGIQAYWLAEADQMTSSKPKMREMKLEPHELGVFVYVTNKLMRNSQVGLTQYLTRAATEEINWFVGNAIVNGNGAGQPKGFLNSGSLVSVAKEGGQAATTIVGANIAKMFGRMHPNSIPNAVWLINQDCWQQLLVMEVGAGNHPVFLPPGIAQNSPFTNAPHGTLLGRPIVVVEYCKTLGTKGDIFFADLRGYATGTRGGVMTDTSMHLRFDYNETAFRFLFEADGQTWLANALTPANGTNTLSSFISLDTRA